MKMEYDNVGICFDAGHYHVFPPDFDFIKEMFEKYEVEYEILENDESIEIE